MSEEQTATVEAPAAPLVEEQAAPEAPPVQEAQESPSPATPDGQSPAPPDAPPKEAEPDAGAVPAPEAYVLPEGMPDELRQFAHDNKLSQAQLDASLTQFARYASGVKHAEAQTLYDLGQAHIKNWGQHANTNLTLARQALTQNDPEGSLTKALKESGWANHPAVLDFLANIGKSMQEGGFLKTTVKRPPGKKNLAQALFGENHPSEG